MNENLINQIVLRILSDPALQALLQESLTGNGDTRSIKRDGLILLNYVPDLGRVLSAVKNRYGKDYTLCVLPSDQVSIAKPGLPEGMTWITPKEALTKSDWQKIILPTCSLNILAKVALGIRDNPMSEIIGRGINEGRTIELVTEYFGLTAQIPQVYRELYDGYLQKIKTYGILVKESLDDECFYELSVPMREEIRFTKKFLGDKQACGFPEESRIIVKQGTVISPLARDTLKQRRIELYVEKEVGRG